jgi:hypothetical protein
MTTKRVLQALSASLVVTVILVLVVIGLNRPVDEFGLLLMCVLVVGAGVFTGMKSRQRQRS